MLLPEGVNPISFYEQAKAKKIKITSRYGGVNFHINGKSPSWTARCHHEGRHVFIDRFEFSIDGEKKARAAYLNYLKANGIEKKLKQKEPSSRKK